MEASIERSLMGFDDARIVLLPTTSGPMPGEAPVAYGTSTTGEPVRVIGFQAKQNGPKDAGPTPDDVAAWLRSIGFVELRRIHQSTILRRGDVEVGVHGDGQTTSCLIFRFTIGLDARQRVPEWYSTLERTATRWCLSL